MTRARTNKITRVDKKTRQQTRKEVYVVVTKKKKNMQKHTKTT